MKLSQMSPKDMRVDITYLLTYRHRQKNLHMQMKTSIFHLQTFITRQKIIISNLRFNSLKSIFTRNKNIVVSEKKMEFSSPFFFLKRRKNSIDHYFSDHIFWCENRIRMILEYTQKERVSNHISSSRYRSLKLESLGSKGI